jgi:hypothetical protein
MFDPQSTAPPTLYTVGNGVEIRASQSGFGHGLFVTRAFQADEPITEYYGKLLTWRESRSLPPEKTTHIVKHIAMTFSIDGLRLADGTPITDPPRQLHGRGGGAFANDARNTRFSVNADFDFWDSPTNRANFAATGVSDPRQRITFIKATKPLSPGDEVFVDYGTQYWSKHSTTAVGAEACGIPHCSSKSTLFHEELNDWFCSSVCASHAQFHNCPDYRPVGARVDVDDLQLATVGNGVFLAPSTIVSTSTGESIGLGLFAGRDFYPKQPITQYYGHSFKDSERPEDRLEHAIEAVGGWVIDATRTEDGVLITDPVAQLTRLKVGGAGYANDLDFPRVTGMDVNSVRVPEGAVTNALFRRIMDQDVKARVDRGEPIAKDEFAIFLEATTHIPSGSEIFVSYNLAAYITPKSKAETFTPGNQRDGSRRKQSAPKRR